MGNLYSKKEMEIRIKISELEEQIITKNKELKKYQQNNQELLKELDELSNELKKYQQNNKKLLEELSQRDELLRIESELNEQRNQIMKKRNLL